MSTPILSCSGVTKTFRQRVLPASLLQDRILRPRSATSYWEKTVLENVSLDLGAGEWVGIYGPNGAGKSTLLRILAGLMPPDIGHISHNGSMSCFFDLSAGFHPERTAVENIYLHGLLHGRSPSEIRRTVDAVIEFAGTESHRDLPMKCYSTGMQMRVAFAASSMIDADIYLFDEVLAVGDADFHEKCTLHLHRLREAGKSAIIVLHSLPELHNFCDRVLTLEEGRLVPHAASV